MMNFLAGWLPELSAAGSLKVACSGQQAQRSRPLSRTASHIVHLAALVEPEVFSQEYGIPHETFYVDGCLKSTRSLAFGRPRREPFVRSQFGFRSPALRADHLPSPRRIFANWGRFRVGKGISRTPLLMLLILIPMFL